MMKNCLNIFVKFLWCTKIELQQIHRRPEDGLYNDYAVMSLYDGAQLLIAMLLVISAGPVETAGLQHPWRFFLALNRPTNGFLVAGDWNITV